MIDIILLGASGSIGKQSIDVIKQYPNELRLVGVSVGKNEEYLEKIIEEFNDIKYACTIEPNLDLENKYPFVKFFHGDDGLLELANFEDYDTLINALVGFAGFKPTIVALQNNKNVALANKETLVGGGKIVKEVLKESKGKLMPIDSEHCAIYQCLQGHKNKDVNKLIVTASGGSFRDLKREELKDVTVQQALHHPNWHMGAKITIDSATMMNKGFEVIEAHYLFDMPYEKIEVLIHPESIIHSMVEYQDGAIMAQLGVPDMRLMIKYALLAPNHLKDETSQYLDFEKTSELHFRKMDYERYPLVKIARQVGEYEGNLGAVMIGANDEAVSLFLQEKISFLDIETLVYEALRNAPYYKEPTIEEIIESHRWAKEFVDQVWNDAK